MFNSAITLQGHVSITLNGEIAQEIPNLVVTAGKGFVASRMKNDDQTAMSHMAVGTSSTAPAGADTTLASEAARVGLTSTSVSSNTITYVANFAAGTGSGPLKEAGIFNASAAGTMLCRTVFDVVNKGVDDSMAITWTITAS